MDFGKYIHELLLENDIVIVPGFGAFVAEYKPAEINSESGEMKPPAKIISFNQQIRNNDGLLVGYVSEKKRISHFEALKRIEKERENILYNLDRGERVELNEVGTLFYTEDHKIMLQPFKEDNLLLDSFGLETTTVKTQAEEKLENVTIPPQEETEAIKEENEEEVSIHNENKPDPVSEPEPAPIIPKAEEKVEGKKKKRGWLLLMLVLIPLILVSGYIAIFEYDIVGFGKEKEPEHDDQLTEHPTQIVQDTIKTEAAGKDSIEVISPDTTSVKDSIPKLEVPETDVPKYYLVGGSFEIEENAETYLKEQRDKGFEAFHVGKKGKFFIIGIGTYDTFKEAEKAKDEYLINYPDSKVWVYKR